MRNKKQYFQRLLYRVLMGSGLLVLVGLTACSTLNLPGTQQPVSTPTTAAVLPQTGGNTGGPAVTVADQEFDGKKVIVAQVVSQGPGWIAIHTDQGGRIGPAIAFAPVKDGLNKDVVVDVDPSQATSVMYAMLHADKGEVGKYEFPGPDVPVTTNGEMISPSFKITTHAGAASGTNGSITVHDQQINNGKVTIDEVVSPGPGWVAIHVTGPDEKPGPDIGFVHVNAGSNKNVTVTIDASRATLMLYAMLHSDAGEIGTYEYPGPDVPVEMNGQMIAVPFHTGAAAQAMQAMATPGASAGAQTPAATMDMPAQPIPTTAAAAPTATKAPPTPVSTVTATQAPANAAVAKPTGPTATSDMAGMQMNPTAGSNQNPSNSGGPNAILPYIKVVDQPIVNGTVTVPEVFALGSTWLVIHRQNSDGQMGVMIGYVLLNDGMSKNVVVPVEVSAVTPVLYAMLHTDRGVLGKIEFPGPDEPVSVRGQAITPSFKVLESKPPDVVISLSNNQTGVKHLTDDKGNSLYISLTDQPGKSLCTGNCLKTWKPVVVQAGSRLTAGAGIAQDHLGVILLPDGSRQATYSGAPLYTYVNDTKPGDAKGQGIDGNWFLVAP